MLIADTLFLPEPELDSRKMNLIKMIYRKHKGDKFLVQISNRKNINRGFSTFLILVRH